MSNDHPDSDPRFVRLPSPTIWPLAMAFGLALVFTAMVTTLAVGIFGALLAFVGAMGWFRQVLPEEAHEDVAIAGEEVSVVSARGLMPNLHPVSQHRQILPVQTFHITTGIKGGIAGGIAMTVPAAIFSILKYHSVWYAMNLLAAGGFVSWANASDAFLSQFHLQGLLAAFAIHAVVSVLVGLLYGAMLPMFPKYPIITAGFIVPLLFTGILHSAIEIVSPILDERIDWFWFIVSQFAFGLVCGWVVNLQAKVRTSQFQALPFAVRAGIHSDARPLDKPE
jgi:hypothetical protein